MKILIVTALLASVSASSFPELDSKCNIEKNIFWRSTLDHNPNTYLYCNNKLVTLGTCPAGTGFLKTGDTACTSFTSWKCLKFDIILECDDGLPGYIRAVPSPNLFSFCQGNTVSVASCPTNHGFATGPEASGCMPWSKWNEITNCFDY